MGGYLRGGRKGLAEGLKKRGKLAPPPLRIDDKITGRYMPMPFSMSSISARTVASEISGIP
jgi:hypothetical protein